MSFCPFCDAIMWGRECACWDNYKSAYGDEWEEYLESVED